MATEGSSSDTRSQCDESSVVDTAGDDHLPQANDSQNVCVFTSDVKVMKWRMLEIWALGSNNTLTWNNAG